MGSNAPNLQFTWPIENNNPTYPKNGGDEAYPKVNNEDLILELPTGMRYAKKQDGDEIYPKNSNGDHKFINSLYALDKNQKPIFPKYANGDEFYVEDGYGNCVTIANGKPLERYAKTKQTEIYPYEFIGLGMNREVILNTYAKDTKGVLFYPMDEYGNEYTVAMRSGQQFDEAKSFPAGYPITNDNYVILSNVNNQPHVLGAAVQPKMEVKNIVGKLFRSETGYNDYLTDVQNTSRKSRSSAKEYIYLEKDTLEPKLWTPLALKTGKDSKWNWLFIILFILLGILIIPIAYVFLKNRWY